MDSKVRGARRWGQAAASCPDANVQRRMLLMQESLTADAIAWSCCTWLKVCRVAMGDACAVREGWQAEPSSMKLSRAVPKTLNNTPL